MCCWQSIVNTIIQKIIKEMHQTAAPEQREWARENILDAVVEPSKKLVTLQVSDKAVMAEIIAGQISKPIDQAIARAYPGYWLKVELKQPLNLAALASEQTA